MSNRAAALYRQAARVPAKTAVFFEGDAWSFARLLERAQAYAAGLADAGFGRGDKLGLMLSTRPEFIALEYAAYILGGTLVPLNVHYLGHEIEHALGTCAVEFLVLDGAFAGRLAPDLRARCPALRGVSKLNVVLSFKRAACWSRSTVTACIRSATTWSRRCSQSRRETITLSAPPSQAVAATSTAAHAALVPARRTQAT